MNEKQSQMLERIYREIIGDEYTEGLIPEVKRHSKEIEQHASRLNQHDNYFKVMIICVSGLFMIAAFWNDLKQIFQ